MKHFLSLTIPLAIIGSALAWGQDAPKLNARELFYSPPPNPAAGTASTGASSTGTASTGTSGAGRPGTTTAGGGTTGTGKSGGATGTSAAGAGKSGTVVAGTKGGTGKSGTTSGATSGGTTSGVVTAGTGNTGTPASGTAATGTNSGTIVAEVGQTGNVVNTSAANGPLGLRYAVLKRESGSTFKEVDPEAKFHTGDSIRLNVTPSTSGYLYVVQQGASGIWTLLFPRPEVANGSNFVEKGQMLAVPNEKAMWTFDSHAGEEKLFIVLARKPEPDLDKLIYSIGGGGGAVDAGGAGGQRLMAQATVRDDVVNHLRDQMLSRDLVFEKVDENTTDSTGVHAENAAYVVSKNTAPDARLVKDLTLSHQ